MLKQLLLEDHIKNCQIIYVPILLIGLDAITKWDSKACHINGTNRVNLLDLKVKENDNKYKKRWIKKDKSI